MSLASEQWKSTEWKADWSYFEAGGKSFIFQFFRSMSKDQAYYDAGGKPFPNEEVEFILIGAGDLYYYYY